MSTPNDHFRRFLDIVAEGLGANQTEGSEFGPDGQAMRGDDIAARAYRSRSHFDRVVAAAAGETPARFRRRVLLERAAFRLLTSSRRVLDVAIEAGYSSNEAFTRSFRRAYGSGPSAWRASPGQVGLATPNGVHFHPPGGLRIPAEREVSAMDLLVKMVEHHVWLTGRMIESAEGMSDEQLDAPIKLSVAGIDHEPTPRKLLSRLVGQMAMWNAAIAMREYDWSVEEHEELGAMAERLAVVGPAFQSNVNKVLAENRIDETFVDALCEPAEVFTYGGMIAHVLTFAAHRRTLLAGALDSVGIEDLGNGDPMRWVAQPTGTASHG